jgi:purine-nucleoside phosphorylase
MGHSALGFEQITEAKDGVERLVGVEPPEWGIVLGSGLGRLTDRIVAKQSIAYSDIVHMPSPKVVGHRGQLVFGELGKKRVVCMSGRVHLYEGHHPSHVVFGARLLAALGCRAVLLTNAAGGIADGCGPGSLMLISDHINLTGSNPLTGLNEDRWGPRFVDMSQAYDKALQERCLEVAERERIVLERGVYAGLSGPTYETPAEVTMLERMGASAVGMSTVLETIALRHQHVPVLGISCITNRAAGKSSALLSHDEVAEVAGRASQRFCKLVAAIVQEGVP